MLRWDDPNTDIVDDLRHFAEECEKAWTRPRAPVIVPGWFDELARKEYGENIQKEWGYVVAPPVELATDTVARSIQSIPHPPRSPRGGSSGSPASSCRGTRRHGRKGARRRAIRRCARRASSNG